MNKVIQITIITFSFLCFSFLSLYSQTTKKEKEGNYKVTVTKTDKSSEAIGYLTEITDSSIIVTDLLTSGSQIVNVNVMDEIKIKRKGGLERGVLSGVLVGLTAGALIGYASGDDSDCFPICSAHENAVYGGIWGAFSGGIIGGIIGHYVKTIIPIKGNQGMYNRQKEKLKKYQLSF